MSSPPVTRRCFSASLAAAAGLTAVGRSWANDSDEASAIDVHGRLSINDGKVVDQQGTPLSLAGPSLFWHNLGWAHNGGLEPGAYYNAASVRAALELWNAPIVRAAIGVETPGGYIENPGYAWARLTAVVDAAIDSGMYVIVDWHTHHAEEHVPAAHEFFAKVASRYSGHPNLIYELYNEPLPAADWQSVIKPYAEPLIDTIRKTDTENLIVVGTRSWSQDVDEAAESPIRDGGPLAYTLHFYAGTHCNGLRAKARRAVDAGLPLVVTEWGAINANGDGTADIQETERWMQFLREHKLTHCNWSLHSKEEGASILQPGTPPDGLWGENALTETGKLTTSIMRRWHTRRYLSKAD
ncbi:MAG: glycoside hydrolase family 5 protein [Pseudomonadota bacterium]